MIIKSQKSTVDLSSHFHSINCATFVIEVKLCSPMTTFSPNPFPDLVEWQYLETYNNTWISVADPLLSRQIETGLISGQSSLSVVLNGNQLLLDLETMTHSGVGGSGNYKFRRISNKTQPDVVYERKDDFGWVPYDVDSCELMRLAESSGRGSTTLFIGGDGSQLSEYKIDFSRKRQTNVVTQFPRRIRVSMAPASTSSASSASASSSAAGGARSSRGTRVDYAITSATATSSMNVESVLAEATIIELADECAICMCPFDSSVEAEAAYKLKSCVGHGFHKECIREQLVRKGSCAICKFPYLVNIGDQPVEGKMSSQVYPPGQYRLSGFPATVGTILITYHFPSGVQGPEHPSPGQRYSGTTRTAYLPDNPEGREMLGLLKTCFERRLTFTVGTSLTTGQSNCVVWNGVHHKTSPSGGTSSFGWPDDTYFARVKDELKAKGVI